MSLTTKEALIEKIVELTGLIKENLPAKLQEYLPLSGGTMTGDIVLPDGGTALSDATVGTIVTRHVNESVTVTASSTTITSINLSAGVWVVTGKIRYSAVTIGRVFVGVLIDGTSITTDREGVQTHYSSSAESKANAISVTTILKLTEAKTVNLIGYADNTNTTGDCHLTAVRIV